MKFDYLPTGEIIFDGITYPGKRIQNNITFNPEAWFEHWRKLCLEIKKLELNYSEIQQINKYYLQDLLTYGSTEQMQNKHQQINEITNELRIALITAYSNYQNNKWFGFFLGLFAREILNINPLHK